jgi:hypothetical protein
LRIDEAPCHRWAFYGMLLAGLAARLAFITVPMRYDEAYSFLVYASGSASHIVSNYGDPNNHVFHNLLVHAAWKVFGSAEWALRLPALLAGVLVVPAAYVAGRRLYGKEAGLLAAAFMASSSPLIEYSCNARGYTIICLLGLVLLALASRLIEFDAPVAWRAFALTAALGAWTVPVMLYPFAMTVLWLFAGVVLRHRGAVRRTMLFNLGAGIVFAGLLTVLFYLPILLHSGPQVLYANRFVAPESWGAFLAGLPGFVASVWQWWMRDVPTTLVVALAAGAVLSVVFHHRAAVRGVPLPAAAAAAIIPIVLAQRAVRFPRVWLFLLPIFIMTAMGGLCWLARSALRRFRAEGPCAFPVLAVLLASMLLSDLLSSQSVRESRETGAFPDGEQVVEFLQAMVAPGDAVIAPIPAFPVVEYYSYRHGLPTEMLAVPPPGTRRFFVVLERSTDEAGRQEAERQVKPFSDGLLEVQVARRFPRATVYIVTPWRLPKSKHHPA